MSHSLAVDFLCTALVFSMVAVGMWFIFTGRAHHFALCDLNHSTLRECGEQNSQPLNAIPKKE